MGSYYGRPVLPHAAQPVYRGWLRAGWTFAEEGGTSLRDRVGARLGTLNNFASPPTGTSGWQTTGGAWGPALAFDGTNDHITVPTLDLLNDVTIVVAFQRNGGTGATRVLVQQTTGAANHYNLNFQTSNVLALNCGSTFAASTAITDALWHCACATWRKTTRAAYICLDGKLDASNLAYNPAPAAASGNLFIGKDNIVASREFPGQIACVLLGRGVSLQTALQLSADPFLPFREDYADLVRFGALGAAAPAGHPAGRRLGGFRQGRSWPGARVW